MVPLPITALAPITAAPAFTLALGGIGTRREARQPRNDKGPLGTLPSGLEIERRNEDDLTVIEGH